VTLHDLYDLCRESWAVSSIDQLKTFITEFKDHDLLRVRPSSARPLSPGGFAVPERPLPGPLAGREPPAAWGRGTRTGAGTVAAPHHFVWRADPLQAEGSCCTPRSRRMTSPSCLRWRRPRERPAAAGAAAAS